MAQAIVTPTIRKRAEQLAERIPLLPRGRSKINGAGFYVMPGSTAGVAYYTSSLGCTCKGFLHRGVCAHQQACVIVAQREQQARYEAAAPLREANRRAASERIQARRATWKSYAEIMDAHDGELGAF